jgi:hypothetical protein
MAHNEIVHHHEQDGFVQLPTPTIWPLILALGITLGLFGLVTHWAITVLGLILAVRGAVGWFGQMFPHERHEPVTVSGEIVTISTSRTLARALRAPEPEPASAQGHRLVEPLKGYNLMVGLKGGIAGGVAMSVPAGIFGIIAYHSIWYPLNLLAAGGFISWASKSDEFLAQFHLQGLLAGLAIHAFSSILVGLLYGAMLPMFPRKPILTAGFVAPLIWTGILYTSLGILSPILDARIHWGWFVVSQFAFGLVAGYVVNLQVKVKDPEFQALPFAVRAGLHTDQTERASADENMDENKDGRS